MRWPGWCCTSGEHGRDGTSETVEKIGSNANEFFKAQKSNCKSPAAPQCCEGYYKGMVPRSLDCSQWEARRRHMLWPHSLNEMGFVSL